MFLFNFLDFFVSCTPLSTSVKLYIFVNWRVELRMSTSQMINCLILLGIVCLWVVVHRLVMGETAAIASTANNSSETMWLNYINLILVWKHLVSYRQEFYRTLTGVIFIFLLIQLFLSNLGSCFCCSCDYCEWKVYTLNENIQIHSWKFLFNHQSIFKWKYVYQIVIVNSYLLIIKCQK